MMLFHDVIQVLVLPEPTVFGELPRLLQGLERRGIRHTLIHGDNPWSRRMPCPQRLPEEPHSGLGISRRTQPEVEGIALRIDCPVEVVPLLLDLDVCFIDPVRVIRGLEMWAAAFIQFGCIPLDPPNNGGMVNAPPPAPPRFLPDRDHVRRSANTSAYRAQ
jgi:hypothetical protein